MMFGRSVFLFCNIMYARLGFQFNICTYEFSKFQIALGNFAYKGDMCVLHINICKLVYYMHIQYDLASYFSSL